jgi:hypothetical protein
MRSSQFTLAFGTSCYSPALEQVSQFKIRIDLVVCHMILKMAVFWFTHSDIWQVTFQPSFGPSSDSLISDYLN